MAKETIKALVSGGKATAAPPLGPALGPVGVNIGLVVAKINEKTKSFSGMQVPVEVIIDSDTKEFDIKVGTPPSSALLLKEAGIEKGSGNPKTDMVADILIEQIIKVAKMKEDSLTGKSLKEKVMEIVGTCNSMGILVEGMPPQDAFVQIKNGRFDEEIKAEKTELTEQEKKKVEEERNKLQEELKHKRIELEARAKTIIKEMEGKERNKIKARLIEDKIPQDLIEELLPAEAAASGAAKGAAKPAEKKAAPAKK